MKMIPSRLPKIAIATGDAGGIGPEISIKSALDPSVRALCQPILVSDPVLLEKHARACGLRSRFRVLDQIDGLELGEDIPVLDSRFPEAADIALGEVSANSGRASLVFARTAIKAALAETVDAVVAAPQNQKA